METIKRIEKEAREYAITLVDEDSVEGTPQLVCYIKGAISERNNTIEDVKQLFESMFAISPKADNIVEIMEQVRKVYESLERLKIDLKG